MTAAALVLAQILRLTAPQLAHTVPAGPDNSASSPKVSSEAHARSATFRYHVDQLARSLERYSLDELARSLERYRLDEYAQALDASGPSRYHLSDLAQSLDLDRCICVTTRLSPVTLRSEVLLVSDCGCGK